jgi:hypothetical protein
MTWWGYILLGVGWIATVTVTLVMSLDAATNAVSADLAADPNGLQIGTAVVSAVVFAGPGLFFILKGIRQGRRRS